MVFRTFVFLDLETTGLPRAERNEVKITELCFLAVSRYDIIDTKYGVIPPHDKLSLLFNPEKEVNATATQITGLSQSFLKNCSTFAKKVDTILAFLKDLEEPICLVAHNGNAFDFKVLLTEFVNAGTTLPSNLHCVDSLLGFRRILKNNPVDHRSFNSSIDDGILTDDDDDDEFPALNISNEDWSEIDKLSLSLSGMAVGDKKGDCSSFTQDQDGPYKLSTVYKRLLNKNVTNAHRAEGDCLMLLECVVALKEEFLYWADACSKRIDICKLFIPYEKQMKVTKKRTELKNKKQ